MKRHYGYVLLLVLCSFSSGFSQSPGGVSTNLRLWLKANAGVYSDNGTTAVTVNGTAVQQWNDQSPISNHTRQTTAGNKPVFNNNVINKNPALHFSSDQFLDGLAAPGINSNDSWAFFLVFRQTSFSPGGMADGSGTFIIDRPSVTNNLTSFKIVNTDKFGAQKRNDDGSGLGGPVSSTSAASTLAFITDSYRQFGTAYGLYLNGKLEATNGDDNGALTGPILRIGRHATTTNGGLNGDLAEMIVYNTFPTVTQRQQIESYLAIKYGVTLDQSSGGKDYVSSSGSVIFPATTGFLTYNNNIAGIGQDNGSALTQPASTSQNNMAILSVSSPSALSDGNFLMWGDDSPTITNSTNVPNPFLYRLSRVWRAKVTGSVGTVTLSFDLSGLGINMTNPNTFALLTNSAPDLSAATVSTATRSIVGNVVSFTGITLTDGMYFSLATSLIPGPGGVTSPLAWLRADKLVYTNAGTTLATNGQTVQQWNDYLGSTNNASQATAANRPTFVTATANNNPIVQFPAPGPNYPSLDFGALGVSASSSLESIVAIKPASINSTGTVNDANGSYFVDRTSVVNPLFSLKASGTKFGYQKRNDSGTGIGGVVTSSNISTASTQLVDWYRNFNVQYGIGYNGSIETTLADADGPMTLPNVRLGNSASANIGLIGDLPEYVLYSRNLTTAERTRVNSYLAIKYGVTLSQSTATDYLSSTGSVIFAATSSFSSYASDVAGIGRDDVSSLTQLNSQSVNVGAMVNILIGSITNDLTFLVWGSNNGNVNTANSTDVQAPILRRMSRVWRAANTNSMGPVTVKIDLSTVPGAKAQADLRLLVDADGVFNAGATSLTGTLAGSIFTVTNVTLANGSYFTVGSVNIATPLPVQLTKFEAMPVKDAVNTSWTTASELNADYFDVQRSQDGETFEFIGKIKAAGTSNEQHQYYLEDTEPYNGVSYYRLKQVDFDGVFVYSDLRKVTFDGQAERVLIYPNPTAGTQINLRLQNWAESEADVSVRDIMGNRIFSGRFEVTDQQNQFSITLPSETITGIYIVSVRGRTQLHNVRVLMKP